MDFDTECQEGGRGETHPQPSTKAQGVESSDFSHSVRHVTASSIVGH